jgi:lipopolysaccharide biosynthesis glycosyltransferase
MSVKQRRSIAVATDERTVLGAAVTLRSARNTTTSHDVDIIVLYRELSDVSKRLIECSWPEASSINLLRASSTRLAKLPHSHLPAEAFLRLLLPEMCPNTSRIVYLDTDVIVRHPLQPLWDIDLAGLALAAVRNVGVPFISSPRGVATWRSRNLDPTLPFFNSGVLLMDLDQWRERDLTSRVLEVARKDQMTHDADQSPMNVVFAGEWLQLDPTWNQHPLLHGPSHGPALFGTDAFDRAIADPSIVHFIGPRKPWHAACNHPFEHEWRTVARDLVGAQWKPEPPSASERAQRALSRGKSAIRRLLRRVVRFRSRAHSPLP